ncbi:MAG TPA: exosortase system-associated protein, TIGR04073 family [Candidatus Binatia bacterium]|jgi:putative exosortase-associated protein (TIGR04073 family)|nr:exosortase system-associated protein, TIGR04073 family [Candidatus Binatia bacterium]
MRKTLPLLALLALAGILVSGCANPERKFGRGMGNMFDIVRGGEFRRTMEQSYLYDGPDFAYTTGFFRGINRTFARTGIGIYEVVTAPFPNPGHGYDPICTSYLTPAPVYPDNYAPNIVEDSMFVTDSNLGFGGGDVLPMVPGSRFRIFDTQ